MPPCVANILLGCRVGKPRFVGRGLDPAAEKVRGISLFRAATAGPLRRAKSPALQVTGTHSKPQKGSTYRSPRDDASIGPYEA